MSIYVNYLLSGRYGNKRLSWLLGRTVISDKKDRLRFLEAVFCVELYCQKNFPAKNESPAGETEPSCVNQDAKRVGFFLAFVEPFNYVMSCDVGGDCD